MKATNRPSDATHRPSVRVPGVAEPGVAQLVELPALPLCFCREQREPRRPLRIANHILKEVRPWRLGPHRVDRVHVEPGHGVQQDQPGLQVLLCRADGGTTAVHGTAELPRRF